MSHNKTNMYDIEPHIAEIYDNQEAYTDDVKLIQSLLMNIGLLRIIEPFCGTGRILIPMAIDGHEIVGLDQAEVMLNRARDKIKQLPEEVQRKITLAEADVISEEWPREFDLVILGGNCLYELATPEEQERCIIHAATSLKSGGHLYVDNDHMEDELDSYWQESSKKNAFPTGRCSDGTNIKSTMETIWFDKQRRLARFRRCIEVKLPGENVIKKEYIQEKHPVSTVEVKTWLETHGFNIIQLYGDHSGNPYVETLDRAIFWAVKE